MKNNTFIHIYTYDESSIELKNDSYIFLDIIQKKYFW